MRVTPLYAGLLTPLFIFLAVRVIGARRSAKVAIGDGGDDDLRRRMRVRGNFSEYVPLALILMGLAESLSADQRWLHLLGLVLLVERLSHAFGVSRAPEVFAFRTAGIAMIFAVLTAGSLTCPALACLAPAI